ncbi:hypothetical protein ACCD10_27290, partial [Pseudomonas sp. Pseusp122]
MNTLAVRAEELQGMEPADLALVTWLREIVEIACSLRGVIAAMVAAIEDPDSALHASCVSMKASGTRLLERAQTAGLARSDMDGADLLALSALSVAYEVSRIMWERIHPRKCR